MKLFKPLSLALSALLLVGSLVSCGETIPTPEEIYNKVENADSAKLTMTIEIDDLMTSTATVEGQGDNTHVVMDMEIFGSTTTTEYYVELADEKAITYTKDGDGWDVTDMPIADYTDDSSLEAYEELFKSANYGEYNAETRRYEMKADTSITADGMTMTEGYIQVNEDGTFEIYAKVAMEESGMSMTGSMSIKVEKIGGITVTLPEA